MARMKAVLDLIKTDPNISRPSLAAKLNISEMQVKTAIEHLKSNGILQYEGAARNGRWIVHDDNEE